MFKKVARSQNLIDDDSDEGKTHSGLGGTTRLLCLECSMVARADYYYNYLTTEVASK